MRILNVAYPFAPVRPDAAGGAEQVLAMLDRELCAAGHESFVIACEGSQLGGHLIATPLPEGALNCERNRERVWSACRAAIDKASAEWKPELIHIHGLDFLHYLPAPGLPVLATLHLPPAWYPAEAFAIQRPGTWLNCVSESQEQACPKAANLLPFIANGVSPSLFRNDVHRGGFALSLGRICPEKGFDIAMEAAQMAGVPFLLAGEVHAYEEHQRYFRERVLPKCGKTLRFIGLAGFRRKRRLLSAARCLLAPSLVPETSSLVAMEAGMCGSPVVAFRSGALSEIIEHGVTGFLVDDARQMADAIARCGEIDAGRCRDSVCARFDEARPIRQYLRTYAELIGREARVYAG